MIQVGMSDEEASGSPGNDENHARSKSAGIDEPHEGINFRC